MSDRRHWDDQEQDLERTRQARGADREESWEQDLEGDLDSDLDQAYDQSGWEGETQDYGQGYQGQASQNYQGYQGQASQEYGQNYQGQVGQYSQGYQSQGTSGYGQSCQGQAGQGYDQNYHGQGGQYSQNYHGQGPQGYGQNYQSQGGQYSQNYQGQASQGYGHNYQGQAGQGYGQNYQGQGGPYNQNYQGQNYRGQQGYGQNYQGQGGPYGQTYQGQPGYQQQYNQQQMQGKNGMKKPKKKRRKTLFIVELVVLLILAVGVFAFTRLSRMERVSLKDILTNDGAVSQSGYQNIVLYGVDSREGNLTKEAHSDTIIICSINKSTKDIKLVSVYRDTYLDNTNGEYRKATECYYFGGPERSINMLNKNLDLDIQDYVAVNFQALVEVIDLVGGVDIELTDEEVYWLNGYLVETSQVVGVSDYQEVSGSGLQHLNGLQAVAYCRIRYTEGYDFKRTERQRTVLTKVFEKAQSQGITTLLSMVDTMLPSISTSLTTPELISLVSGIGGYSLGETSGFPFDQYATQVDGSDVVVPVNLAANVTQLHQFLFGTENYQPSATVQEISSQIINYTGIQ